MTKEMGWDRRNFLGAAVMTIAAGRPMSGFARAQLDGQPQRAEQDKGVAARVFGLKQIEAGVLNVGYAEAGPPAGSVVILLHGWPYDIYTYIDVAPVLASAGYRVIIPYLRGYGTTHFLSTDTPRNGQQAALAVDVVALMDALGIDKAIVAGCDWGARTANIVAALWPARCQGLVSVSGYLIGSREANRKPLPPDAEPPVVVSVLFRDGTRPRRVRGLSTRLCEADLANRLTEVAVRRRDIRSQRCVIRQSGSRQHRDSQLSLPIGKGHIRRRLVPRRDHN